MGVKIVDYYQITVYKKEETLTAYCRYYEVNEGILFLYKDFGMQDLFRGFKLDYGDHFEIEVVYEE